MFVVVNFGGAIDPAAVLFERQGLHGNTAPRRQTGQGFAGTVAARTDRSGGDEDAANEHLITMAHGQGGAEIAFDRGPTLTCNHEAPILARAISFGAQNSASQGDGVHEEYVATLDKSKTPAVAFQERGRVGGRSVEWQEDIAYSLNNPGAGGRSQERNILTPDWAVRRLTPNECHSLQGFPQDHCAITYRNKPAADGPQYKALGNSMAVPVINWIMDRMRISMAAGSGQ